MSKLRLLVILMAGSLTGELGRADEGGHPAAVPLLASRTALHVGIVVPDIDVAIAHWMALLNITQTPPTILSTGHAAKPTKFRGQPVAAQAKLAFFQLENLQIELIQPVGDEPSDWGEFLSTKGPGVHHLAFGVSELSGVQVPKLRAGGYEVKQEGGWDGGEYLYLDSLAKLGVTLELLERYAR
jgi:methylmalonyl-CoA/ethylmalonyl-CoA epimerase